MRRDIVLFFKNVESKEDIELLRVIRNQCREFMTRDTQEISQEQQKKWFKTAKNKYDLFLVYAMEHGAVVTYAGYGVIHKNETDSMVTGGFLPEFRDQGLGRSLFKFLTDTSLKRNLPVRLEVLKNNIRARKVYEKLGFVVSGETDDIFKMEFKNDPVV